MEKLKIAIKKEIDVHSGTIEIAQEEIDKAKNEIIGNQNVIYKAKAMISALAWVLEELEK